ncbi:MAG: hypothetical protein IJC43_04390 [Clostridia bacterium]|nr:hypothetical protein [Clostridia bacterium]
MKKLLAFLLTLALLLSLVACGGGDDEAPSGDDTTPTGSVEPEDKTPEAGEPEDPPGDGGEASLDNVTDSNYAALAEELFGIDADPEGDWALVKAESTGSIAGGMVIVYQGADAVDTREMMRAYYEAAAAVSTMGICVGEANSESSTGMRISEPIADFDTFYENHTSARGALGDWIYEYNGKQIELKFALSPEIELTLQINFVADHIYG